MIKIKAIILAAGYGTRLYPLTINTPKQLLKVANKPVINHIIEKIEEVNEIDQIYIITNNKFYKDFLEWNKQYSFKKPIKLLNDKTTTNENKLGAIGDINFVIKKEKVDDDLLIIAGDNLFEFALNSFVSMFKEKNSPVISAYDVNDLESAKLHSIIELDKENKLIYFEEKPKNPKTTLISACIYLFPKNKVHLINNYLKEKNNPDCPGFLIQWLYKREKVYTFKFNTKWYDIGSIDGLKEADKYYSSVSLQNSK